MQVQKPDKPMEKHFNEDIDKIKEYYFNELKLPKNWLLVNFFECYLHLLSNS